MSRIVPITSSQPVHRRRRHVAGWLVALLALALASALRADDAETTPLPLQHTYDTLMAQPHRLAGSAEGRAAGDFILSQLRAAGVPEEAIFTQEFPGMQLAMEAGDCYFERDGQRVELQPIRPNGIALPVTPAAGITGATVYLGDGAWERFVGQDLTGKIAVLDYNCDNGWIRALERGAVAIIFVEPALGEPRTGKPWTGSHFEFPRYLVSAADAEAHGLLGEAHIRVYCRMRFQAVDCRNIFVLLPGSDAEATAEKGVLALASDYDTYGPTPFANTDATQAASIAALIEAARSLASAPPDRPTLIAFFDNNTQNRAGQSYFYYALAASQEGDTPVSLAQQIAERALEGEALQAQLDALADTAAIIENTSTHPAAADARLALVDEAQLRYDDDVERQSLARFDLNLSDAAARRTKKELRNLEEAKADLGQERYDQQVATLTARLAEEQAEASERIDDLEAALAEAEAQYDASLAIMRLLKTATMPSAETPEGGREAFARLLAGIRERWRLRIIESAEQATVLESYQAIGERFREQRIHAMFYVHLQPYGRAWTISLPSGGSAGGRYVANRQLERWIEDRSASIRDEGQSPGFAGYVPGLHGHATLWDVSAHCTYVAEIGAEGAVLRSAETDMVAFDRQVRQVISFVREAAAQPEVDKVRIDRKFPAMIFNVPTWSGGERYAGSHLRRYNHRTKLGEPLPGAVGMIWPMGRPFGVVANDFGGTLVRSDLTGTFPIIGLNPSKIHIDAAVHDEMGRIQQISMHPLGSLKGSALEWEKATYYDPEVKNHVLLFVVEQRLVVSEFRRQSLLAGFRRDAADLGATDQIRFINGINDGLAKELHVSEEDGDRDLLCAYVGRLQRFKLLNGPRVMLNNSLASPQGSGYDVDAGVVHGLPHIVADSWILNESRLSSLREHNIQENELERLHGRSELLQDRAVEVVMTNPEKAWALDLAASGYTSRVYGPVRAVTNDLVKAVVVLLLLSIPFSFAVERVVSGTANVYRQIGGFLVVFICVFSILYTVHPAFQFATFPLIILLAFAIIIMSSTVLVIMWGKFEYEVRKMHGLATASHTSSRSTRGTIMAATAQGIATMRRRPLRTALTTVTISLLTFTILFFASFKSGAGLRRIQMGAGTQTRQVEVTAKPSATVGSHQIDMLQGLFGDRCEIFTRSWQVVGDNAIMVGRLPDDTIFSLDGQSTLHPRDLGLLPGIREALVGDVAGYAEAGGVFLPQHLYARATATEPQPTIDFAGRTYVVRGTFDPARLLEVRTLDGNGLIPPDLAEVRARLLLEYPNDSEAQQSALNDMALTDFPLVDAENIALLWSPEMDAQQIAVRSVVLLPKNDADAWAIAEEMAILLDQRIGMSVGSQAWRVIYGQQLSVSGLQRVLVPLVLGGLIILGTMLSSVSDREREIFTFSALGLGPKHVAALFFAEAAVYAVVGGMSGYLCTHLFGGGMEMLARMGWIDMPAMNQSSLNSMVALLIVMATVMLSTIYPAYKASRSANPGVQRSWRMPDPVGDRLEVVFPFTVADYDMIGLSSFIEEYLASHRDRSVGWFAADGVNLAYEDERFVLTAKVWLQPFDQGVSQNFELVTRPSDIEGIDEVQVNMTRLSGDPIIWRRSGRIFVDELRQQFIFWRTIPDENVDAYHAMTVGRFGLTEMEAE